MGEEIILVVINKYFYYLITKHDNSEAKAIQIALQYHYKGYKDNITSMEADEQDWRNTIEAGETGGLDLNHDWDKTNRDLQILYSVRTLEVFNGANSEIYLIEKGE